MAVKCFTQIVKKFKELNVFFSVFSYSKHHTPS